MVILDSSVKKYAKLWIQSWESTESSCSLWKYHGHASKSRIYNIYSMSKPPRPHHRPIKSSVWEESQDTNLCEVWRMWAWNLPQVNAFLQFSSVLWVREPERLWLWEAGESWLSTQSGGVCGSCGSNLVSESTHWLSVGTWCHPQPAKWEPGWLSCGAQVPMVSTIHLDVDSSVSDHILLSSVLSALTDGCWDFNLQTFLANNTVCVKCLLPPWKPLRDLVMSLQKC